MQSRYATVRRDPRVRLAPGGGSVRFDSPGAERCRADLRVLGPCGLAFVAEGAAEGIAPGSLLSDVAVQVGPREVLGRLSVTSARRLDSSRTEIGGLFYPAGAEGERRLMTLLAGLRATPRRPGA